MQAMRGDPCDRAGVAGGAGNEGPCSHEMATCGRDFSPCRRGIDQPACLACCRARRCGRRRRVALVGGSWVATDLFPLHRRQTTAGTSAANGNEAKTKAPARVPGLWKKWWSQGGSNSRPRHCERRALPAELWPHGCGCCFTRRAPGRWGRRAVHRAAAPRGRHSILMRSPKPRAAPAAFPAGCAATGPALAARCRSRSAPRGGGARPGRRRAGPARGCARRRLPAGA